MKFSFFWTNISYQLSEDIFHFVWNDEKCFLIYLDWTFFYRVNIWIDKPYLRQNMSLNPGLVYTTYVFFQIRGQHVFRNILLHQMRKESFKTAHITFTSWVLFDISSEFFWHTLFSSSRTIPRKEIMVIQTTIIHHSDPSR